MFKRILELAGVESNYLEESVHSKKFSIAEKIKSLFDAATDPLSYPSGVYNAILDKRKEYTASLLSLKKSIILIKAKKLLPLLKSMDKLKKFSVVFDSIIAEDEDYRDERSEKAFRILTTLLNSKSEKEIANNLSQFQAKYISTSPDNPMGYIQDKIQFVLEYIEKQVNTVTAGEEMNKLFELQGYLNRVIGRSETVKEVAKELMELQQSVKRNSHSSTQENIEMALKLIEKYKLITPVGQNTLTSLLTNSRQDLIKTIEEINSKQDNFGQYQEEDGTVSTGMPLFTAIGHWMSGARESVE